MLKEVKILTGCCAIALVTIVGCSQESKDEYSSAGQDVKSAAQKTGKAISEDTRKAAEVIKDKTKDWSPAMSKASDKAKADLDNDKTSLAVTQAIGQAKGFTVDGLKVDTNGSKVTLHGAVTSAAQKHIAGKVAKDACGAGCSVDNEITVTTSN